MDNLIEYSDNYSKTSQYYNVNIMSILQRWAEW